MFAILQHNSLTLPVCFMTQQLGDDFELIARFKAGARKPHQTRIRSRRHSKTNRRVKPVNGMI